MKTKKMMYAMVMLMALASGAAADEAVFRVDSQVTVATGSREAPGEAVVYGSVTLSAQGEIRILWNGVSLNVGDYSIGSTGNRTYVSANLPTAYLDLQKIFGVKWMEAMRLALASGSYLNDPILGKTDLALGQISINLTQTLASTKAVKWTATETAGVTGYFQRQLYKAETAFEAVPVNFALDTSVVAHIAPEVIVAVSLGAFANICNGINQNAGFRAVLAGAYLAPSVSFGDNFSVGARLQGTELIQIEGGDARATAFNVSGFVKYAFAKNQGRMRHALELNIGALDDGTILDHDGNHTRARFAGLRYSVGF